MKKKLFALSVCLAFGSVLTLVGINKHVPLQQIQDRSITHQEIAAKQKDAMAQFRDLEHKMAQRKTILHHIENFNESAKQANHKLDEVGVRKRTILASKPIRDGQVVLSDDELDELAELNQEETKIQEALLNSINTLKDL